MSEEVRLSMPADPGYLRLARVAAMGIASRQGFTFDEIEDLRIAIDELCFALIGSKGREGNVQLAYRIIEQGLEVEGVGDFSDLGGEVALTELSELIVSAVTDEHELGSAEGAPRFRMVKRHDGDA